MTESIIARTLSGIRTLDDARAEFAAAWGAWLKAAGLTEDTPTAQLKNPESG